MVEIKLQYSVVFRREDGKRQFVNLFNPGIITEFFISNKWVWLEGEMEEDGFYQETEILENQQVLASSSSDKFFVRLSHIHHNRFVKIKFKAGCDYQVRVRLLNKQRELVKGASLNYPLFIR